MPAITASEVVIPNMLTADARQRLIDELYAVHCQIFDGVERASFAKYVVESKADQTIIQLHKNTAGRIVGYFAVHVFERELCGTPTAVFRMEAGTLREYRGNNANLRFGIAQMLRYRLAHPGRPLFYLGTLVHPSSYMLFAKYSSEVWPNRARPLAPEMATFMADLAAAFELEPVDPRRPLVVHVGWRTRDTEVERNYWRACTRPAARFFVQENPTYSAGHGLMTLVPLTGSGFLRAIGRVVADRGQRQAQATLMAAQRLPLAGKLLGTWNIRRRLRHLPLFADVSDADLANVVRAADVRTLPAGSYVLREGDVGTDLYVIASGSVYALIERAGEERIIDQLTTGEMFGEIAMLSGEPRTATIRTATKTTLIRLNRTALLSLMEAHPRMRDAIWAAFATRRFELTAGGTTRFGALSRAQRLNWFARSRHAQLAAGVATTITDPWLFVLTGTVEIRQNNTWLTVRAPALIEVVAPLQVVAQVPSRIVQMPSIEALPVVAAPLQKPDGSMRGALYGG